MVFSNYQYVVVEDDSTCAQLARGDVGGLGGYSDPGSSSLPIGSVRCPAFVVCDLEINVATGEE